MIKLKTGNIFDSEMQTLVNPINCVGTMGAGLARQFKIKYPRVFYSYRDFCKTNKINVGELHLFLTKPKNILLFPTKKHWINPSKIEYIINGLDYFVKNYRRMKIMSVAFPMLGCGLGGLNEELVKEIMMEKLKETNILVEIYQNLKQIKKHE